MRKIVKPFDPAEVAKICPIVREVIVMGGGVKMINKIIKVLLFLWFVSVLNWVISLIVAFVTKETDYMAVSALIESIIAIIILLLQTTISKNERTKI